MSKIIGIDLGTANSCAAVMIGGEPTMIANAEGDRIVPSAVYFENGGYRVGQNAKRQAATKPDRTILAVKREIGSDYKVGIDGTDYTATEISALILMKLKANAEDYLGEKVTQAVITVPASFTNAQRIATLDAGRIAGFKELRLINEPSAAAMAYGFRERAAHKILLCNLGAGNFEVSAVEVGDSICDVLATASDGSLGAAAFDRRIAEFIAAEFQRENGIDLRRDSMALQRLMEAAEKAKIELSSRTSAGISLPFIAADAKGARHLSMTISRAKFNELTADLVEKMVGLIGRTVDSMKQSLREAGKTDCEISKLVLVGGASRIPAVKQAIRRVTGMEPVWGVNPDECFAKGAAIQGGVLNGEVKNAVLLDVMPLSLGIGTSGGAFTRIIRSNTNIPVRRDQTFSTSADNQIAIDLHVLQGESDRAADNATLGRFQLTDIPPAPRGEPRIDVSFEVDLDGIVHLSARNQATGEAQPVKVSGGAEKVALKRVLDLQTASSSGSADGEVKSGDEICKLIESLLPSIDNLERALRSAQPGDPLAKGVEMTLKMLLGSLQKYGLEEIPAEGQRFDPYKHNAVASERFGEPGMVLEVFQKGYRVKDKVIRYAMVKVSV